MNTNQLASALRQELTRSPKQAVILGISLLVALYFWAPLVCQWLPSGNSEEIASAAAQQLDVTPAPQPIAQVNSAASPSPAISGKQLFERMEKDQLLSTANYDQAWIDPFRVVNRPEVDELEPAELAEMEQELEAPPVDPTPTELGLVLNSTIVGPRLKTAQINGATFTEFSNVVVRDGGDTEPASTDEPAASDGDKLAVQSNENIIFQLAHIDTDYVVLSRNGKTYELKMQRAGLANESVRIMARPVGGS